MKDLTKIYIDLRKCTEEQLRIVRMTLYKNREYVPFFTNLFEIDRYYKLHYDKGDWLCGDVMFNEKTEILFPEFIKLFEGGEGENGGWIKIESEADLPKEIISCWFKRNNCEEIDAGLFPIIKPLPPKF